MNKIVYSYSKEEEIPETLKDSYVFNKETGIYVLDGFTPKEEADAERRRADHIKADKERAEQAIKDVIGDRKASEVKALLQKLEEEKNKPQKKDDSVPVDEYIKVKEQLESLLPDFENLKSYKEQTENQMRIRRVVDELRKSATEAKMNPDIIEDLERYASDFTVDDNGNVYIDLGNYNRISPEKWVESMKSKKPSWFPAVVGGNMKGGSNGEVLENPYLGTNRTHMLNFKNKYGEAKATEFARQAGKNIHGTKL
jgi:DNA repair exonuclease SbcCD ATPase subunit